MSVKFDDLNPLRSWDTKGIVAPEIGPKSFGTFEKQATGLNHFLVLILVSRPLIFLGPVWIKKKKNIVALFCCIIDVSMTPTESLYGEGSVANERGPEMHASLIPCSSTSQKCRL